MWKSLQAFRRGWDAAYAQHGGRPVIEDRREEVPPAQDEFERKAEQTDWIEAPPCETEPAPHHYDEPPAAPHDAVLAGDKEVLAAMELHIMELVERERHLAGLLQQADVEQKKDRQLIDDLRGHIDGLKGVAARGGSDPVGAIALDGLQQELRNAYTANNNLKADLNAANDARDVAEAACAQLRTQALELRADAKKQARGGGGDQKLAAKVWAAVAKEIHPSTARPGENGEDALSRALRNAQAEVERLTKGNAS